MANESDLETLLAYHPYLIAEEFSQHHPKRQLKRGRNRLDLAFELPSGLCIVELKKTHLIIDDVRQLLGYCRAWSRSRDYRLSSHHYLIGKRPRDEQGLLKITARSRFEIRFLYLDEDIPTKLAWDEGSRRYCSYDSLSHASDCLNLVF